MKAKVAIAGLLILARVITGFSQETASTAPNGKVTLHYGKEISLPDDMAQTLRSKALKLLESSNFNSSIAKWREIWGSAKIQDDYRKTVAGKFLLVAFDEPKKINTTGGDIIATKIVIGLNRPDYASELFTIDDEDRIVMHAKYSGLLCTDMLDFVKSITK
jgi:hypothetical protein